MAGKQKRLKSEHKLRPDHGWRCKPGYQVIVLNRGAVRFDTPNTWVVSEVPDPGGAHFTMHDKPEPDDDIRFQVSVFPLMPGIDWSGLPLDSLLTNSLKGDERPVTAESEPALITRPGVEIAWQETSFIDPEENRAARTRACLARGADVHTLITMDFWVDQAERGVRAWDELVRTLRLGQYIKDPLQGPPVFH